jgi:hypothetical protein
VQIVLSFVVLVLLAALSIGLPAILLIRSQIQRQAWAQVDQGSRATQALYEAWESNLSHLATLTGDRPTLHALQAQCNQAELTQYMQTLRSDTELDLLIICDTDQGLVSSAGAAVANDTCSIEEAAGFYILPGAAETQIWLLAAYDINAGTVTEADILGKVVVGIVLDDKFVIQSREQTGPDHTLFSSGQPVASSLPAGESDRESITGFPARTQAAGISNAMTYQINSHIVNKVFREDETLTEVAKRLREKGVTYVETDILEGSAGVTFLHVGENLALARLHLYMHPP